MEFGQIPQLLDFQDQSVRKLEVVNEVNPSKIVENNKESEEVIDVIRKKSQEIPDAKEVKKGDFSTYNQVSLTNLSFGFNPESKDFFIKVKRGDFEAQYPTDEMMRLKALQMQADEKELKEELANGVAS